MRGKSEVITALNELLAEFHTSVVACATNVALCHKWGYDDLSEYFEKLIEKDIKSIDKVLNRIVFLEGNTELQNINQVPFSENIEEMTIAVREMFMKIIALCTDGIETSVSARDYGTRSLFEKVLNQADNGLGRIEAKISQLMR